MAAHGNESWDDGEIQGLAQTSGKPLEVVVAQEFLKRPDWTATLGTHYQRGSDDTLRELDVLAVREAPSQNRLATFRFRVLVSCRGFPENRSPLAYVLSDKSSSQQPQLLSKFSLPGHVSEANQSTRTLPGIESTGARILLSNLGLSDQPRIIAWDMIEREERIPKGKSDTVVSYRRAAEGDRLLFGALDSAFSAAMSWITFDANRNSPGFFATLEVPICVLAIPFWAVGIDAGRVSKPEIRTLGYQSNAYPQHGEFKEVLAVICSVESLNQVVKDLDSLADSFFDSMSRLSSA